jgi:hypothetical protein
MNDNANLATLICPNPMCRHQQRVLMPTTFCQLFYTCEACSMTHARKSGDCCVFCSYADKPCPSMQEEKPCCQTTHSNRETTAGQG